MTSESWRAPRPPHWAPCRSRSTSNTSRVWARLDLTDEEKERLRAQLGLILEHAAKVGEVAWADVPPTAQAIPRTNVLRPDEPRPSLSAEEVLSSEIAGRWVGKGIAEPPEIPARGTAHNDHVAKVDSSSMRYDRAW